MINICFMGSPKFALKTLETLNEDENINISLVVSQEDKKRSRNKFTPTEVKKYAQKEGLEVATPKSVNDPAFIESLKALDLDFIVVVAFGQLIGQGLLAAFPDRILNLHPSSLPKYRGAAPIQFSLLKGEEETSATTMLIEKGMDSGDILLQKPLKIEEEDDFYSLSEKLSALGAQAMRETVLNFDDIYPKRIKQDDAKATFSKKITKEMGYLDFKKPTRDLVNQVRALVDFPKASFAYKGERVKVLKAGSVEIENPVPGLVYKADRENNIVIGTGDGGLEIKTLQFPGKKALETSQFLLGNAFETGINLLDD